MFRDGRSVVARVWVYEDKPAALPSEPETLVRTVRHAAGTCGRCYDYVGNVYAQLAKLGIDDPAVTQLWRAVSSP